MRCQRAYVPDIGVAYLAILMIRTLLNLGDFILIRLNTLFNGNRVNRIKAHAFTRESGSPLGMGTGREAQKNRRMVVLSKEQMDAWNTISLEVMRAAAFAKYEQHPDSLPQVLRLTDSAELYHLVTARGKPSELVRFHHLEEIRTTQLSSSKKIKLVCA